MDRDFSYDSTSFVDDTVPEQGDVVAQNVSSDASTIDENYEVESIESSVKEQLT